MIILAPLGHQWVARQAQVLGLKSASFSPASANLTNGELEAFEPVGAAATIRWLVARRPGSRS